jgi:flagellar basal-body rod modification protein FlgD
MASPVSALTSSQASTSATAASSLAGASAPNEQMFLQLLVAQLKNQDPMSPTDGTQFVSQLAQFSELEQVIAIRSDIEAKAASATTPATTPATPPATPASSTTAQTPTTGQTQP